jgi:tetratricopeptide (TPR) repeat protein
MNPRSAEDFVMRATLYQELDQYDKAHTDLQAAVALKPDDAYVRVGRARLLMALGDEDRALADFEKAIELEGDNARFLNDARFLNSAAWSFVRYPHTNTQWVEKALTWAQRAVEMTPTSSGNWNTLGIACYRTGNWQDAVNALEKSEELYPHEHLPFNGFFLAMAHWQLGHQDEARQWYDKAVETVEKKRPNREEELLRFRAEAEELMGIEKQKKHKPQVSRQGSDALEFAATSKPAAAPKPGNN